MDTRLRALCDLSVAEMREGAGRHEYDGVVQDLSPDGVTRALAVLGGEPRDDLHDEAHVAAFEGGARLALGELELHRRHPMMHVANLELACYDREYAPEPERAAARRRHLAAWPDGVAAAVQALDRVPREVARAALSSVRGLAAGVDDEAALAAHDRLVALVEQQADSGDPDASLGPEALAALMGVPEGFAVDLDQLAAQADREQERLDALLREAAGRLHPGPLPAALAALRADHPDAAGVLDEARALTAEVIAWTAATGLVPYDDGECRVGPSPASRSFAMASMSWAAPGEPDAPSWYHVTPPDPGWPAQEQQQWLQTFNRASLAAICLHEVAPGHFSHGRALRHVDSPVRRLLMSPAFIEGWAHYAEELALEEGFRGGDPRVQAGVAIEALVRVTRLRCAIGIHRGELTVAQAAQRFASDALLQGPAAVAEARRATYDPTYGRYTWGKLAILELRQQARRRPGFSLAGFHRDVLALGAPPLGLLNAALV